MVALCLTSKCRGCVCNRERSCVLPVYCPKSSVEVPVWESCVDKLMKILLCEGGDVELSARTLKHIRMFAFDSLTLNSLSPY